MLIGSPLGLAQAARLSWLAGRCAFSPCAFVLASAQHLLLHPFFVGFLAALRLFGVRFVVRLVFLSHAFGYAEHIVLSLGSSVLRLSQNQPAFHLGFVTPPWGCNFGKRRRWLNLFLFQPLRLQFMRGLSFNVFFWSGLLHGSRIKTALLKLCAPQRLGLTLHSTGLPSAAG